MKRFLAFMVVAALTVAPFTGLSDKASAREEVIDQGIQEGDSDKVQVAQFLIDAAQVSALPLNAMPGQNKFATIYEGKKGRFAVLNFGAPDAPVSDSSLAKVDGTLFTKLDLHGIAIFTQAPSIPFDASLSGGAEQIEAVPNPSGEDRTPDDKADHRTDPAQR